MNIKLDINLVSRKYENLLKQEENNLQNLNTNLIGYTSELYVIQMLDDTSNSEEQLESLPKIISNTRAEIQESIEKIAHYKNILKKSQELVSDAPKSITIKD